MPLTDLLTPDAIIPSLRVNGKKQALQEMSERAAAGVGAVRRAKYSIRSSSASASGRPASATASPSRTASSPNASAYSASSRDWSGPIDFEALDGLPVDLIFLLVAPESAGADHLKALAMIARVLRNSNSRGATARDPRRFGPLFPADADADFQCGVSDF